MSRWDWFWAVACAVMAVWNVIEGDALMAVIAGLGCGIWMVAIMDEVA